MKLPLPTYQHPGNAYQLIEAASMFAHKIDEAVKVLIAEPNMRFHGKNHMIQLIMHRSGMFMSEESFRDVEAYLAAGADTLLRDYGVES
ncbi:hypothetical protein ABGT18_09800 [Pseudomonas putida]|uniref:Uncharacterized protein n=1 Tax=Pseudomonas plecoglossicida TaxID=70775 RepID=A0AAD0QZI5_PSEDL|nr:hypothetical protein [Pseudomonas plecoglossicida]AXM97698.1 hypothetical protein DVB73_18835 [Pseudomonas plecoglossicida]EPB95720.1 hypothetical protein L321_11655 [Pseudomonas plecoglossicida NB2011]QLB57532.1 hypothetical protein HAV28_23335 [Pseudomonas plecoglossicida]